MRRLTELASMLASKGVARAARAVDVLNSIHVGEARRPSRAFSRVAGVWGENDRRLFGRRRRTCNGYSGPARPRKRLLAPFCSVPRDDDEDKPGMAKAPEGSTTVSRIPKLPPGMWKQVSVDA